MTRDWLKLASDAFASSTSYVDANYRKKWDDSLRMFQSRHPSDSKYNTESYKHRSKIFRPKTRSLVRKHEAATAASFFSNSDVISTAPINDDDQAQAASAALMKEILQYRLTKSIPWFQLVCGGMQDAMNMGVVCSYQYWKYKERAGEPTYEPAMDESGQMMVDETGQPMFNVRENAEVLEDKPCIELIPVENIRFDPGADWINPAASSPYLIRMIPMYVTDLKQQMKVGDDETKKKWKKLTDGEIKSAQRNENDQTRQTREQSRQDSTDTGNAPLTDFEIAWVHENFIRIDGEETVFYTLGTEFMLSKPTPIKEVYFTGDRPIVIGTCVIETHVSMPVSPVMMAEQLQREVNEIANQRLDNVKLVLNKRYVVKRGAQVDLKSIVRNVPASITLANDPVGDVRALEFSDVTSSSYQEQDRLNVDYDELTGNFSQGSVMTNRKMGETVGGMGMISNAANQITEYTIRTFTETWVEPVLRQLVKLEQKYETDQVVLAIAAGKAKLLQKYGVNQVSDELLNQELTLTVNVGMGATDPTQRLNKYIGALSAFANVAQMQIPNANMPEIGKEIFGLAGYRDGARFVGGEDGQPQIPPEMQQQMMQMQQALQQAQQELQQAKSGQEQVMIKVHADAQQAEADRQAKAQQAQMDAQVAMEKANMDAQIKLQLAEINNQAAKELAEINRQAAQELEMMRGDFALVKEKCGHEMRHAEAVAGRQPAEPVEEKPTRKVIEITAPSGAVYRGVIESDEDGQEIGIESPDGGMYSGTVK
jgi:hypothetical protein